MKVSGNLEGLLAHHIDFSHRRIGDDNSFVFGLDDNFSSGNIYLLDSQLLHHLLHFPGIHAWQHFMLRICLQDNGVRL